MATIIKPKTKPTTSGEDVPREVEYPVVLARQSKPVLRLPGILSVIRQGRRDMALSEQEWQELGLEDVGDGG
jgi:hypothetical protein